MWKRAAVILVIIIIGIIVSSDSALGWIEDTVFKGNKSKYYEPIYQERYGEAWTQTINIGTNVITTNNFWEDGSRLTVADPNIGTLQRIYATNILVSGEDYGELVLRTHRIYIPKVQDWEYPYTLELNIDYLCDEGKWDTSMTTILKAYYLMEFYNNQNTLISWSSTCYVANFDNRPGYSENLILNDDGNWHTTGGLSYTLGYIPNIEYLRIVFVLKGSWLTNSQDLDNPDGCQVQYGNIRLNYPIFSGFSYSKGDPLIQISRTLFSDDLDNYVAVSLFGSSEHPDGTDYGSLACRTPPLYFNNLLGDSNSHVEIFYQSYFLNINGPVILRGYLKVHYYTNNHVYLGTDVNKFFDYNTATPPFSSIIPTSGTIVIENPSDYPAKYIEVEIVLTGSWLEGVNGVTLIFSNLNIAGGGGTCLEYLYYYQSDYARIDCEDRKRSEWYYPHYFNDDVYGNMLFSYEKYWNEYESDDAVQSNDFTGTNIDDVKSSDYFVFTGHGGNVGWDTYLCLTSSLFNDVDDDDIGDWGPETEIVFLCSCNILGSATLDSNNREEWEVHGLYYNHMIMGFTDKATPDYTNQGNYYKYLIIQKKSFTDAFQTAYASEPWCIIFDDLPHMTEYFWRLDPSTGKDMAEDESIEDSTYYCIKK